MARDLEKIAEKTKKELDKAGEKGKPDTIVEIPNLTKEDVNTLRSEYFLNYAVRDIISVSEKDNKECYTLQVWKYEQGSK